MVLDIRPILRGDTDCIEINYVLTPEQISGVEFGKASVKGSVTDTGSCIELALFATVDYKGECARCLDEVNGTFEMDFVRTVADEKTLSEEALLEEDGIYAVMRDGRIDIDDELLEELLLSFPTRLLCSDDCQGLCQKCGKPKKLGCDCSDKEIDPRLAVLKNLVFDDESEN